MGSGLVLGREGPTVHIGAALGAVIWFAPQAAGGGEALVGDLLRQPQTLGVLVLLLVVRTLTTVGSYGVGLPSGIIAPMLALGTIIGAGFDHLVLALVPGLNLEPGLFAVAAMGALFAATGRALPAGSMTSRFRDFHPAMLVPANLSLRLLVRFFQWYRRGHAHRGLSCPVASKSPNVPIYHVGTYSKLGHERYRKWFRSIRRIVLIFLATIAVCAVGLLLLDSTGATLQSRVLDAIWNAANTISTLGSLSQLNDAQRVFMIVAMLTLVGTGGYAVTSLAGALSSPDVQSYLENRRMEKILSKLEGHVILAGFGAFGQKIAEKLRAASKTVVVIDRNPDAATAASNLGYLTVQGSISQDGVLDRVHTDTAEAFVVTIPDPDRMLAATLMARNLNPAMRIYVVTDTASPWLIHAGASEIIMSDEVIADAVIGKLDADRCQ